MPAWLDRWAERRRERGRRTLEEAADDYGAVEHGSGSRAYSRGFDLRTDVVDAGDVDRDHLLPLLDDPAVARSERAARDAARVPYRAPIAKTVLFTRMPGHGETQLEQLAARLTTLRADRVFGVYRAAERFDAQQREERHAYVEWEIAHAPDPQSGDPQPPHLAGFGRGEAWARRTPDEARVLDEDMAATLVARADLDPADCFGLTRLWHVVLDEDARATAHVQGALVITRRDLSGFHRELVERAPLDVQAASFEVVVLDWNAIAEWVVPDRRQPPRTPSPLPHLPASPQELLLAFLEIVGIRPQDCYGAQVTRTNGGDLGPAGGIDLPTSACADGTARARLDAAEHVVVSYRTRPEYAEGLRRWEAYEDDVLRARLSHLSGVRPALAEGEDAPYRPGA